MIPDSILIARGLDVDDWRRCEQLAREEMAHRYRAAALKRRLKRLDLSADERAEIEGEIAREMAEAARKNAEGFGSDSEMKRRPHGDQRGGGAEEPGQGK